MGFSKKHREAIIRLNQTQFFLSLAFEPGTTYSGYRVCGVSVFLRERMGTRIHI